MKKYHINTPVKPHNKYIINATSSTKYHAYHAIRPTSGGQEGVLTHEKKNIKRNVRRGRKKGRPRSIKEKAQQENLTSAPAKTKLMSWTGTRPESSALKTTGAGAGLGKRSRYEQG